MSEIDVFTLPVHPFANIIPQMSDDEFENLVADIDQHGVREPVWTDGVDLYDGRHRRAAVEQLREQGRTIDLPYRLVPPGLSPVQAIQLIASLNIHRRQLTASQLAAAGVKVMELIQQTLPRGAAAHGNAQGTARDQAAAMVGASGRTVGAAAAVKNADPHLFEQVAAGQVAVTAAVRELALRQEASAPVEPALEEALQWSVVLCGRLPGHPYEYFIREDRTVDPPLYHAHAGEVLFQNSNRVSTEPSAAAAKRSLELFLKKSPKTKK